MSDKSDCLNESRKFGSIFLSLISYLGKAAIMTITVSIFIGASNGLLIAILMALSGLAINSFVFYMAVLDENAPPTKHVTPPQDTFGSSLFLGLASLLMLINAAGSYISVYISFLAVVSYLTWPIAPAIYTSIAIGLGVTTAIVSIIFASKYILKYWEQLRYSSTPIETASQNQELDISRADSTINCAQTLKPKHGHSKIPRSDTPPAKYDYPGPLKQNHKVISPQASKLHSVSFTTNATDPTAGQDATIYLQQNKP